MENYNQKVFECVMGCVEEMYGVTAEQVLEKKRTQDLVLIRFLSAYCFWEESECSYVDLARFFRRDRSSVYHILNSARNELSYNKKFIYDYNILKGKIKNKLCENSTSSMGS